MSQTQPSMAQQIGQAAAVSEQQRTGHLPQSVAVALIDSTVVVTLHGTLSPAEKALAQSPAAAAQLQQLYRRLFASSCHTLMLEIARITGAAVREASAEMKTMNGGVLQVFATGTVVQVFLLDRSVSADIWSGNGPGV